MAFRPAGAATATLLFKKRIRRIQSVRAKQRVVVDPEQAAVVRRVFGLFADGTSLKKIASALNESGVPAPNDQGRGNKRGRGWGHTTIRAMLQNERYVGRVVWNQSKWVRVPGRKSRRRVQRPESEWVTKEYPELAIISPDLWAEARGRFRRVHSTARGRPAGTGKYVYLVSGLMRCGVCGASMTVVGRKVKGGKRYARFGCTAHYSRGAAICANALTVSERKVSGTLVGALREKLDRPELVQGFVRSFQRRAATLANQNPGGRAAAEGRIRECERRIANLTDSLARIGWSDSLAERLRDEEAQLGRLRAERTAATRRAPPSVPEPSAIAAYLKDLFPLLEADPVRGREILSRFLAPVVMTPETESPVRRYRATGAFNLSFLLSAASSGSGKSS